MKIFIVVILSFFSINTFCKETQFICEYTSEVKINNLSDSKPSTSIKNIKERFTFFSEDNSSIGSYINLKYGSKINLNQIRDDKKITFIENNKSDNLFVVTIFLDKKVQDKYPSIFSQHSWEKLDFYSPKIQLGECFISI